MTSHKQETLNTQNVLSMKGDGYYSKKTAGAKNAIDSIQEIMEKYIPHLPNKEILRFADFGAADGGTSQELWYNLINVLRNMGDNRVIEMLYTDLASNDFSTLFKNMQGMHGEKDLAYQKIFDNVFVHGCGTGFHQQLLATDSLSLGFSATAMHYVSEKPCQIKNHVHMVGADVEEKKQFMAQAALDWESILLSRAKELASGGRFVCMNFGIDEKGRYLGNTGGHSMFDKFNEHWRSHLDQGIITNEEYINTTFAQHYRTVDEFCTPFNDKTSKISKAGLKLLSCSTKLTKCPYRETYEKNIRTMSKKEFADSLIPTTRSWSETVFRTALSTRCEKESNAIIDSFYENYRAEVERDPDGHAMDYIHIIMEIEKI
ncbi:class I SAM-dependent methyltransferase [Paracoccaceae bacterium]|nr:class I SAM-dependent methyltransferase [Paracoccaceae bacterium]